MNSDVGWRLWALQHSLTQADRSPILFITEYDIR